MTLMENTDFFYANQFDFSERKEKKQLLTHFKEHYFKYFKYL